MTTTPNTTKRSKALTEVESSGILFAGGELHKLRRQAEQAGDELTASALWTAIHALGSIGWKTASQRKGSREASIREAVAFRRIKLAKIA